MHRSSDASFALASQEEWTYWEKSVDGPLEQARVLGQLIGKSCENISYLKRQLVREEQCKRRLEAKNATKKALKDKGSSRPPAKSTRTAANMMRAFDLDWKAWPGVPDLDGSSEARHSECPLHSAACRIVAQLCVSSSVENPLKVFRAMHKKEQNTSTAAGGDAVKKMQELVHASSVRKQMLALAVLPPATAEGAAASAAENADPSQLIADLDGVPELSRVTVYGLGCGWHGMYTSPLFCGSIHAYCEGETRVLIAFYNDLVALMKGTHPGLGGCPDVVTLGRVRGFLKDLSSLCVWSQDRPKQVKHSMQDRGLKTSYLSSAVGLLKNQKNL